MHILFVCTANIVRSFMAEAILKGKLKKLGKSGVSVSSAGIMETKGIKRDERAEKILDEMGYSLHGHISQPLTREMMVEADYVLVMDQVQKEILTKNYPEFADKIHLLKAYSREYDGKNGDIKDPYRKSPYEYRQCFSEIYLAIEGFIKCIFNTGN